MTSLNTIGNVILTTKLLEVIIGYFILTQNVFRGHQRSLKVTENQKKVNFEESLRDLSFGMLWHFNPKNH